MVQSAVANVLNDNGMIPSVCCVKSTKDQRDTSYFGMLYDCRLRYISLRAIKSPRDRSLSVVGQKNKQRTTSWWQPHNNLILYLSFIVKITGMSKRLTERKPRGNLALPFLNACICRNSAQNGDLSVVFVSQCFFCLLTELF